MEVSEYIEKRLLGQQRWLSGKSAINRKYYYRLSTMAIVCSALVPVILGVAKYLSQADLGAVIAAILGGVAAILTALSSLYNFKEKWIAYRTSSEALKREHYLYQTRSEPYTTGDGFATLVRNTERILSSENQDWARYTEAEGKDKKAAKGTP